MAADLSTPQKALLALEQAYRDRDIEAAVAAKNFRYEATAMLENLKSVRNPEPNLVQQAAHVLELAFRQDINENGFPPMAGVNSRILETKQLAPDLVEITEELTYSDGYVSRETVNVARSGLRWGIVILPPK